MSRDWKNTGLYQEFNQDDADTRVERFIEAAAKLTVEFLEDQDAFWHWDGHKHVAELTSGKLSNFFANCTPIFTHPGIQKDIAHALCEKLVRSVYVGMDKFLGKPAGYHGQPRILTDDRLFKTHPNRWVVGSAMGSIGLAQSIASVLGQGWKAAFADKGGDGMELKRFDLGEAPMVLLCEDVFTTGGTIKSTIMAVEKKHEDVLFVPEVPTIINRNPGYSFQVKQGGPGFHFPALITKVAETWDDVTSLPERMKGCVPIRPKVGWKKLTTAML
ncbi:hypothetical protein LCGC14_0164330 [marine sediment metagenome]|uniref:Phosphoribosyltransferase domain-containing protein n=1 Tax=marine sediment metagenome TaxID=412755 RepID=A0A0F9UYK1_9ZZZZ